MGLCSFGFALLITTMLVFGSVHAQSSKNPEQSANSHCIALLHGMARSAGSMNPLARYLRQAGYRVVNPGYSSDDFKLAELAQVAVGLAIEECNKAPTAKIHFITHSLGGILVRQYLRLNQVPNLGRVVMLAPPNQGSEVVDQLGNVPGFVWLNGVVGLELGTQKESPPRAIGPANFEVGIIAGTRSVNPILSRFLPNPDDGKVSVYSARLTGMCAFLTLPVTHPFIMRNKNAMFESLRFLRTGRFSHAQAEHWPRRGVSCDSVAAGKPPEPTTDGSNTSLY